MSEKNKMIELLPPRPRHLPPLRLRPGRFYKSRGNDRWCCFQRIGFDYHCIRIPDNVISVYQDNGREKFAGDDESSEHTLIDFDLSEEMVSIDELSMSIVARLDEAIQMADALVLALENNDDKIYEYAERLKKLRGVLGKIANMTDHEEPALAAQDALMWLAEREQNHFKLGGANAAVDTTKRPAVAK